ncbi:hypothetical protein RIF29_25048 [Crotalaria pallida]|uniref:RRM domain-containing protein n=1 Tax=Crotalaria pallida TaxID=3830 RepID=A0AAN9ENA9_CROPI
MGDEKKPKVGVWPTVKPFVNGGVSGMLATYIIQPIDMIKVRIQLGQGSAAQVTSTMLKNEGVAAFYKFFNWKDLLDLFQPYGVISKLVMLRAKNQALIQMQDVASAVSAIQFYEKVQPNIRYKELI